MYIMLTRWGTVTHICASKLTIIGPYNGLSPSRRQAIIWANARMLLIRTLGTNVNEIFSEIHTFSFTKMHLKMSAKSRPFCRGLNIETWCSTNPVCSGTGACVIVWGAIIVHSLLRVAYWVRWGGIQGTLPHRPLKGQVVWNSKRDMN